MTSAGAAEAEEEEEEEEDEEEEEEEEEKEEENEEDEEDDCGEALRAVVLALDHQSDLKRLVPSDETSASPLVSLSSCCASAISAASKMRASSSEPSMDKTSSPSYAALCANAADKREKMC